MSSIWTNNEDNREFYTWRAWRSQVQKKQLNYVTGPKDIRFTIRYFHWARFRIWGVGWVPVSEADSKCEEFVFYPLGDHTEDDSRESREVDGLVILHDRLVSVAAEIEATTTSLRNRHKLFEAGKAVLPRGKVVNRFCGDEVSGLTVAR